MATLIRKFNSAQIESPNSLELTGRLANFKLSTAPLDLEIGCGVGWHPIQYAKDNSDRNLIAIEHTRAKFLSFERRAEAHPRLTNLMPVHADAVRWVTHALEPATVDRVFLLYPNPEPKASNKRWLRMPFFERLLEVLKPGGTVQLATNSADYFEEAVSYGQTEWNLKIKERRAFAFSELPTGIPRTHFEKKYLARGETCFDVTFLKS